MIESLPDAVKIAVGCLGCLALPFVVGWMLWGVVQTGRGVAKGLGGGPEAACEALGLRVTQRGPLSGMAEGVHRGCRVRVSWQVSPKSGFDPSHQKTWVSATVGPTIDDDSVSIELPGIETDGAKLAAALDRATDLALGSTGSST